MFTADESSRMGGLASRALARLPLDDVAFPEPSPLDHGDPLFGRTLRLALAMKGGVSLAVWIGGAVAEVDVLRRIRIGRGGAFYALPVGASAPPARAAHYARLLCSRGYDQIEVDVLAGASAGGLTSVLYASAQRADSDPGQLLDLWLEAADLGALLRKPGFGHVYSILDGDGYFWPRIIEALRRLYAPLTPAATTDEPQRVRVMPPRPGVASRVVVDLSATVIDPVPGRGLVGADGSAGFRFVGSEIPGEQLERRIPSFREAQQPTGIDVDLARLAYAGRTTSSYPGAFEPALVWSHPVPPKRGTPPVPPNDYTDLTFAFSEHREPEVPAANAAGKTRTARGPAKPTPFRVVDGGVLDNIPIDRALRTISDLPSPTHTDRVLIYFDPSPLEPDIISAMPLATDPPSTPIPSPTPTPTGTTTPTAVSTSTSTATPTPTPTPTSASTPTPTPTPTSGSTPTRAQTPPTGTKAAPSTTSGTTSRTTTTPDARRKHPRNDRLSAFVGTIAIAVGMRGAREQAEREIDDVEQSRVAADRARGRRVALSSLSATAYAGDALPLARQRYALMRASTDADVLSSVLAHPHEWQLHSRLEVRRRLRPAPREVRDAIGEQLRAHVAQVPIESWLTGPQGVREHALAGLAWIRALEEHAFATTGCARIVARASSGPDMQRDIRLGLYGIARKAKIERDRRLLPLVAGFAANEPDPIPDAAMVAEHWITMQAPADEYVLSALDEAVTLLKGLAPSGAFPSDDPWTSSPWRHFPAGATAIDLAPFVAPSGVPDTLPDLRFATVTASDPAPPNPKPNTREADSPADTVAPMLDASDPAAPAPSALDSVRRALTLEGQARAASRWIGLGTDQLDGSKLQLPRSADAAVKLAGSRLANFGAFLSADWRENDWWWGRADSGHGLARVIAGLPRVSTLPGGAPTPDWTKAAEVAVEADLVADRDRSRWPGAQAAPEPAPNGRVGASGRVDAWAWRRGLQPLTGLPEALRFGLVSDGVRVGLRAMLPHLGFIPKLLLRLLVPLVAVFVPYVASARRAITAGVCLGLAFLVLSEVQLGRTGPWRRLDELVDRLTASPTRFAIEVVLVCAVVAIALWAFATCRRRMRNAAVVIASVEDGSVIGASADVGAGSSDASAGPRDASAGAGDGQPGLLERIRAARRTMAVFAAMCLIAPLPGIALWIADADLAQRAWFPLIGAVATAATLATTASAVPPASTANRRIGRSILAALGPGVFAILTPVFAFVVSSAVGLLLGGMRDDMQLPNWISWDPWRVVMGIVWLLACIGVALTLTVRSLSWWHSTLITVVVAALAFASIWLVEVARWPVSLGVLVAWITITHAIWWLASFDWPRSPARSRET